MGKIRVYALAKELEVDSQRVIELARELGAKVSRPSNALDEATAEQIRKMQESMTSPAAPPVSPTVVEDAAPLLPEPDEGPETAAAPEPPPEPERAQAKPAAPALSAKRSYLIDGLNVGKPTEPLPIFLRDTKKGAGAAFAAQELTKCITNLVEMHKLICRISHGAHVAVHERLKLRMALERCKHDARVVIVTCDSLSL